MQHAGHFLPCLRCVPDSNEGKNLKLAGQDVSGPGLRNIGVETYLISKNFGIGSFKLLWFRLLILYMSGVWSTSPLIILGFLDLCRPDSFADGLFCISHLSLSSLSHYFPSKNAGPHPLLCSRPSYVFVCRA